jgi:glycosyltransferase involved in cell wall biosynthesis
MRVLLLPDPVPAGQAGGLRTQVMETFAALRATGGVEVALAQPHDGGFAGWDVVHAFGSGSSVAAAIESAAQEGAAVVVSPRLSPAWSRSNGSRARVSDRVLGASRSPELDSSYAQLRRALRRARLVIAHGPNERQAICDGFLLAPDQVALVPHGVAGRFFTADPAPFRARVHIGGRFVLMVGRVAPRNKQLAVARALAELALPLVVIGQALGRDAAYLRELQSLRTVVCVDVLEHDDPLLASAYAAASVLVLSGGSSGESMAASEALAAGTPVVCADGAGTTLDPGGDGAVVCSRGDMTALQCAVSGLIERAPARDAVRARLDSRSWHACAAQLLGCYRQALATAGATPA